MDKFVFRLWRKGLTQRGTIRKNKVHGMPPEFFDVCLKEETGEFEDYPSAFSYKEEFLDKKIETIKVENKITGEIYSWNKEMYYWTVSLTI